MSRDFEAEARKDGWVPKDEWNGPSEQWKDAQTFVENGERIAGLATSKARKLEKTVEELQAKVGELDISNKDLAQFYQRALEKERQDKAALIEKLEQEQVKAINEGDGETYLRKKKEMEKLQYEPESRPGEQPWAKEWASENPWYANDTVARGVANAIAEDLRKQGFNDTGKNFLDEVAKRTKAELPDRFKNPKRASSITGGNGAEADETVANKKSYDGLPAAAKAVCDRLVAQGVLTREQYVADYVE